ncbi:tellurium resistance protein [Brevundimonas phage vB_BpoS-Marchewka]|uniref:Tellurium resistance protein n=1 Tax=Brevundimonas phage vB_BpoS-Marchewka TaxID=2948604 RepID=A0A9E7N5R9_9CAUD|nr:tellurium resistance protein [Brevundimonas phage vB_BpoS-Marchewka]UTC29391.1 tellurium resistance protein [Brevundimonas phage vB_BpoS-Bambus]
MSVIDLSKGGNINLAKDAPGVTRFVIGLGWNANPQSPPDLDASVLPCTKVGGNPVLPDDKSFVFYGNLKSSDGAIIHSGDNLTGDGDGDDERIAIDTAKLNPAIDDILIVVTIHQGKERGQNFGLVRNAYARIYDADKLAAAEAANPNLSDKELHDLALAQYDLEEDAGGYTALVFGELYSKDGDWRFKARGEGRNESLGELISSYLPAGVSVSG